MPTYQQKLVELIEAFAAAKATGNPTLLNFAGGPLNDHLALLPDSFTPHPEQPHEQTSSHP